MSRDGCCETTLVIAAIVLVVPVAVVPMATTLIMPVLVMGVMLAITLKFLVTRNVLAVIPVVLHKQDPLAASVVFAAVPAPMSSVPRRYAQIDRRAVQRYPLDCYRLTIDYLWRRIVADV